MLFGPSNCPTCLSRRIKRVRGRLRVYRCNMCHTTFKMTGPGNKIAWRKITEEPPAGSMTDEWGR